MSFLRFPSFVLIALLLFSCSGENQSTPSYNPGVGPFDDDGNYVEAWADNPPKRSWFSRVPQPPKEPESKPRQMVVRQSPARPSLSPPPVVRSPSRPVASAPKPKPRPVAKPTPKPKPKPEPAAARSHTVAKGDTLYSLSRRYGTSVSAIQKANGISGTNIRIGQRLKIPR